MSKLIIDKMEEIKKQLRPIEQLYLMSKENEGVYSLKNKLQCIINFLYENKSLKLSNEGNKYKFKPGEVALKDYEYKFIELIQNKKFVDLNKFIEEIHFEKSLIALDIIKENVSSRKFLFFNLAKKHKEKTTIYYELQTEFNRKKDLSVPILNIVFDNDKMILRQEVVNFYHLIVNKIKAAELEQKDKR